MTVLRFATALALVVGATASWTPPTEIRAAAPVDDPVPCSCSATAGPANNSAVVLCGDGATTCFKIQNLAQPTLGDGYCKEVDGVDCEDLEAECSLKFSCDVVYVDDCCCNGGDLQVTYDNGVWGPTNDTIPYNIGSESYVVSGSVACADEDKSQDVEITIKCGQKIAFAKIPLQCAKCGG